MKISFAKIAFIVCLPISLKLSFETCLVKDEINIYFLSESSLESVVAASGVVSSETGNIKLVGLRTKKKTILQNFINTEGFVVSKSESLLR